MSNNIKKGNKMKKILLSAMLVMVAMTISAQPKEKTVNVFQPHWYIQLQGGGQYTLGEINFDKLLSPNVQFAIGYQFDKVAGIRLQANAWQSKAGADFANREWKWKWNYVAPGLDFTFNISNLFAGYNPTRVVNVTAFIGGGANIAWKNDEANKIYPQMRAIGEFTPMDHYLWDGTKVRAFGRAGLAVDFRLSDVVSLGLEANANIVKDTYNSKKAGNPDWYFNALAGLKINLGKTHTTKTVECCKQQEPKVIEKIVEKIVEKPAPAPEPAKVEGRLQRDIYFGLCSAEITAAEASKVKEIADYLQRNPNASVSLVGYADRGTGNAKTNAKWAAKRAESVKNALVNKYGVSENRISFDSKGDTVQPFAQNDKNRVTICIAE